jgi:hypothetical protein
MGRSGPDFWNTWPVKKVSRALAALPSRPALDKAHHKTEALEARLRGPPSDFAQSLGITSYSTK